MTQRVKVYLGTMSITHIEEAMRREQGAARIKLYAIYWLATGAKTREEVVGLLKISDRTLRRWINQFNEEGIAGLKKRRRREEARQ